MNMYGPRARRKIGKAMREFKHGQLTIGRSNKKVTSHKQAVAIGISEARKSGAKVPKRTEERKDKNDAKPRSGE